MGMNLGIVSVRATKEANAGGPWVQPRIVQVLFRPTYLGVLQGIPTKDQMRERLTNWAEGMWGEREPLRLFTGPGTHKDLTPEQIEEMKRMELGYLQFPRTAVLVELEGEPLEPNELRDFTSNAWLVMLGGDEIFGGGINRAVQRLIDGYEVVWSDVAINTSP